MHTYISILRGINVSGQKKVPMEQLKKLYEKQGCRKVVTYIQSGNVVFQTSETNILAIITEIEIAINKEFGYNVPVLVLKPEELATIVKENPYADENRYDQKKLYFTILEKAPDSQKVELLMSYDYKPDEIFVHNRVVYVYVPKGYGKTKYSNNFIENKLKVKATTRNLNTVNKLIELSQL